MRSSPPHTRASYFFCVSGGGTYTLFMQNEKWVIECVTEFFSHLSHIQRPFLEGLLQLAVFFSNYNYCSKINHYHIIRF